jgi:hypothetical protein
MSAAVRRFLRRDQDLLFRFVQRQQKFESGPHLYVIAEPEYVKIGWAAEPRKRLVELQVGNARRLEMLITVPLVVYGEKRAHERFAHLRVGGEWFRRTKEVEAFVRELKARLVIERRMQRRIRAMVSAGIRPPQNRLDKLNQSVWSQLKIFPLWH